MSISDCIVSDEQIKKNSVSSEPDRLTGTPAKNKEIFDRLVKNVIAESMNNLIEALGSETAASELGAEDPMNSGSKTVQQILNAFKQYVDELKAENIAALKLDGETKSTVQGVIDEIAQKLAEQIATNQLADGAVTTDKIAESSVTGRKIAQNSIGSIHIVNGAVKTDEIDAKAVTSEKIDEEAVGAEKIAGGAVTSGKIDTKAVTREKIDDGAVGTDQLAADAVTAEKIANGAVGADQLADESVEREKIAPGAVGEGKLADESVTRSKLGKDIISELEEIKEKNSTVLSEAEASAETAEENAEDAEAYAVGKRGGADVKIDDPAYHNNAKYYADTAAEHAKSADEAYEAVNECREMAEAYAKGTVRGLAVDEGMEGFEDNAWFYKEQAKSYAEAAKDSALRVGDELDAHRYDAFPTTTLLGKFAAYTDLGAGDIPLARLVVKRNYRGKSHTFVTVRRVGKNLFNPSVDEFVVGKRINADGTTSADSTVAHSKNYTPVLPNTDYVFSGRVNSSTKTTYIAFYDSQRKFLSRYDPGHTGPCHFKTPGDCHFIRYNARSNTNFYKEVQLEMGTVATDFEAYSAEDFTLRFVQNGEWRTVNYAEADLLAGTVDSVKLDAPLDVRTMRGANYFYVINGTREEDDDGDVNTLDAELRIDQSLIYEKLKVAIVAAGSI